MAESVDNKIARRRMFAVLAAFFVAAGLSSCGQGEALSEEMPETPILSSESSGGVSEEPAETASESGGVIGEDMSAGADWAPVYDYSRPVPESGAADDGYFYDAVFIGDSRTQGFIFYNGLSSVTAYVDKGLKVDTAFTKKDIEVDGAEMSVMDALAQNTDFQKVYIMLGVNELGWEYSGIFIEKYGELVDRVKEIKPDAVIYLQSILPVSEEKSKDDKIYNMEKIGEYNCLIQEMAEEKQVYFLNVAEAVADGDGYLPAEASTDGVHLNKAYCQRWLDYLKTHTVGNKAI